MCILFCSDAVTIVLFQVLGAFANRPLDELLESHERAITVADVRNTLTLMYIIKCTVQSHIKCTVIKSYYVLLRGGGS